MTNRFDIYANYGVLAAEKRTVYTYDAEAWTATCSDKLTVELIDNPWYELYETQYGETCVKSSWGWRYSINELLRDNEEGYPEFSAMDKDRRVHTVPLRIIEQDRSY